MANRIHPLFPVRSAWKSTGNECQIAEVDSLHPERFEGLLQQVDEIMLRETQDWLMLMCYVEINAS